jgi:hypothetical protein
MRVQERGGSIDGCSWNTRLEIFCTFAEGMRKRKGNGDEVAQLDDCWLVGWKISMLTAKRLAGNVDAIELKEDNG